MLLNMKQYGFFTIAVFLIILQKQLLFFSSLSSQGHSAWMTGQLYAKHSFSVDKQCHQANVHLFKVEIKG